MAAELGAVGSDDGVYGEHELEFARPRQTSVWGLIRTIRLKNAAGTTSQRLSVVEDVTDRHLGTARETLLQADLRESTAVIRAAIDALPVVFAVFDTDLRLTSIAGHDQAGIRRIRIDVADARGGRDVPGSQRTDAR